MDSGGHNLEENKASEICATSSPLPNALLMKESKIITNNDSGGGICALKESSNNPIHCLDGLPNEAVCKVDKMASNISQNVTSVESKHSLNNAVQNHLSNSAISSQPDKSLCNNHGQVDSITLGVAANSVSESSTSGTEKCLDIASANLLHSPTKSDGIPLSAPNGTNAIKDSQDASVNHADKLLESPSSNINSGDQSAISRFCSREVKILVEKVDSSLNLSHASVKKCSAQSVLSKDPILDGDEMSVKNEKLVSESNFPSISPNQVDVKDSSSDQDAVTNPLENLNDISIKNRGKTSLEANEGIIANLDDKNDMPSVPKTQEVVPGTEVLEDPEIAPKKEAIAPANSSEEIASKEGELQTNSQVTDSSQQINSISGTNDDVGENSNELQLPCIQQNLECNEHEPLEESRGAPEKLEQESLQNLSPADNKNSTDVVDPEPLCLDKPNEMAVCEEKDCTMEQSDQMSSVSVSVTSNSEITSDDVVHGRPSCKGLTAVNAEVLNEDSSLNVTENESTSKDTETSEKVEACNSELITDVTEPSTTNNLEEPATDGTETLGAKSPEKGSCILQTVVGGVLQPLDLETLASKTADSDQLFAGVEEDKNVGNTASAMHVLECSADEPDGIGGLVINSVVGAFGEGADETPEADAEKDIADISGGPYVPVKTAVCESLPPSKRPRLEEQSPVELPLAVGLKVRPVKRDIDFWDSAKLRAVLQEKGTILLRLCAAEPQVGEEFDTPSDFVGVLLDSSEDVVVGVPDQSHRDGSLGVFTVGIDGSYQPAPYGTFYQPRASDVV